MADARAYQQAHLKEHLTDRFEYDFGNSNIAAAEARLAALENANASILVASGMAAITDTFLHYLPQGSHIVLTDDSYRRIRQFCEKLLKRYGVDCTVNPLNDFAALESAIRPETRLLFSETPSNPYLQILDLLRFADTGRRHGVITAVDATFSMPINTRPLDWGIDLVLHFATKYLGGQMTCWPVSSPGGMS